MFSKRTTDYDTRGQPMPDTLRIKVGRIATR